MQITLYTVRKNEQTKKRNNSNVDCLQTPVQKHEVPLTLEGLGGPYGPRLIFRVFYTQRNDYVKIAPHNFYVKIT